MQAISCPSVSIIQKDGLVMYFSDTLALLLEPHIIISFHNVSGLILLLNPLSKYSQELCSPDYLLTDAEKSTQKSKAAIA